MNRAIIVLGHGSRSPEASEQFLQVVGMLGERRPGELVLPAFMELAAPSFDDAVAQAVAGGATEIIVAACFLFQGNHIKRDIPEMLAETRSRYPQVTMHFARPIGPDPRIAEILDERTEEICCPVY